MDERRRRWLDRGNAALDYRFGDYLVTPRWRLLHDLADFVNLEGHIPDRLAVEYFWDFCRRAQIVVQDEDEWEVRRR